VVVPLREPRNGSRKAALSTAFAWTLLGLTVALVPAGIVLAAIGAHRGFDLPDGWESRLLLAILGGGVSLLFAAVGLLIARAEARNAIGWIFLGAAALLSGLTAAFGYADLVYYGGEDWPGAAWAAWFGNFAFIPAVFLASTLVAQIFPDGRPLPGRWRWVLWVSIAIGIEATVVAALDPGALDSYPNQLNPLGVPDWLGDVTGPSNDAGGVVLGPPIFLVSLSSLVVRFRRSRGIERQQMKWLAFGGAVPAVAFTLSFFYGAIVGDDRLLDAIFITGFAGLMLVPVAVAVAILRYRLYEIDRVISRTLVYGLLTVVLGAAYAGLVLVSQAVFSSVAGGGDLAIAASTLVVAAFFLPLRSRLQRLVDRRFDRRRYDAQRTLEAFGARLREQVDLDGLLTDLERAVHETMQPAHVSLWLRGART
jgi:MFS family permease